MGPVVFRTCLPGRRKNTKFSWVLKFVFKGVTPTVLPRDEGKEKVSRGQYPHRKRLSKVGSAEVLSGVEKLVPVDDSRRVHSSDW